MISENLPLSILYQGLDSCNCETEQNVRWPQDVLVASKAVRPCDFGTCLESKSISLTAYGVLFEFSMHEKSLVPGSAGNSLRTVYPCKSIQRIFSVVDT